MSHTRAQTTLDVSTVFPESDLSSSFSFPTFNGMQCQLLSPLLMEEDSVIVSAPTGSGKTVCFELALMKQIRVMRKEGQYRPGRKKAVYIAPMRSLVAERKTDWSKRFRTLGLRVCELSGDSLEKDGLRYMKNVHNCDIIITTPEKLDSVSRRFTADSKSLLGSISLLMIDEIHLLADDRGAVLESIITRIKRLSLSEECQLLPIASLRIVAASATFPNLNDIAKWLTTTKKKCSTFSFGPEYRPCPLTLEVFAKDQHNMADFIFDKNLTQELPPIIFNYNNGRPTLVFCSSRAKTEVASLLMHNEAAIATSFFPIPGARSRGGGGSGGGSSSAPFKSKSKHIVDQEHEQRLNQLSMQLQNEKLKKMVRSGTAFHHAELSQHDRELVETNFKRGDILVMCCTSTMSMGVNLPAHLVVVLNVVRYSKNGFVEYTRNELLQMIGRAGRKGYDTTGTAVLMCSGNLERKMKRILDGASSVESSLHLNTIAHLNSEIALESVKTATDAKDWIKSTFFYHRALTNPSFYNLSTAVRGGRNSNIIPKKNMKVPKFKLASSSSLSVSSTSSSSNENSSNSSNSSSSSKSKKIFYRETTNLSDPHAHIFIKLRADIEWLCSRHLIRRHDSIEISSGDSNITFKSTELGVIACRSYIEPETAALLKSKIVDSAMPLDLEGILRVITTSVEFRPLELRKFDKKELNSILQNTGRFCAKRNKKKAICRTTSDKIFQLFEHIFGDYEPFTKWNLRRDVKVVEEQGARIASALVKYLSHSNVSSPLARYGLLLQKMVRYNFYYFSFFMIEILCFYN
jgi:replicative superfamily II helicase